ncbi:MAG: prepilin-type N-terminal cleavage/methylation domain-containing protein [Patescibacteria group bacterium]|nr:prepilin-type N-terminal cleavage/methylation domain-containing protein [Patescibacteria group bacterium]
MKIKAFTFIEILISISIVSIIGTYSLYSFFNFYESQNINNKIVEINSIFQEKDRDIKNKKIYDYEIDINKNDKSIIIYTDIYDNNENQKLSYNQNGS